jgi:hypothetical protein
MINGLQQIINDQNIGADRFWQITTTQGNVQICKIIDIKPNDKYIMVEEWYNGGAEYKPAEAFDLICINSDYVIRAELYKEPE